VSYIGVNFDDLDEDGRIVKREENVLVYDYVKEDNERDVVVSGLAEVPMIHIRWDFNPHGSKVDLNFYSPVYVTINLFFLSTANMGGILGLYCDKENI